MYITFILNRYKKYCTVPEVYMDDEICSTVVSLLTQSVNRALAEVLNKFRQYLPIIINDAAVRFPD